MTVGGRFTINAKACNSPTQHLGRGQLRILPCRSTHQSPEVSQVISQDRGLAASLPHPQPVRLRSTLRQRLLRRQLFAARTIRTAQPPFEAQASTSTAAAPPAPRSCWTASRTSPSLRRCRLPSACPSIRVQEYRVITNNFLPEYGRASGGVVALATKSGTNTVHGTIFEFNRLSATTANTVTNAQAGSAKGTYTRNQFGGAVGGPIVTDKALLLRRSPSSSACAAGAPSIAAVPSPQLLAAYAGQRAVFYQHLRRHVQRHRHQQHDQPPGGHRRLRQHSASLLYPTLSPSFPSSTSSPLVARRCRRRSAAEPLQHPRPGGLQPGSEDADVLPLRRRSRDRSVRLRLLLALLAVQRRRSHHRAGLPAQRRA